MLRNWNPLESHILVTKSKKLVAFFVPKICVYHKKTVILQRKTNKHTYGTVQELGF